MFNQEQLIILPEDQIIYNNLIEEATSQLLISRQALPNTEFCDALIRAQKRGVNIQLLLSDPQYFNSLSVEEIVHQHQVNFDMASYSKITLVEKIEYIEYLEKNGICLNYINHDQFFLNHSKFMVIDNKSVFIGSAPNHHIARLDIGILSRKKTIIDTFRNLFYADFQHTDFREEVSAQIAIAPYNSRSIIENLLNKAEQSIHLMFPVITDDYQILNILKKKLEQNVKVQILCSPNIFITTGEESIDKKYNDELISYGVDLKESYHPIIHCRCIIIDAEKHEHATAYIGSGNLKTSSLDSSREVGIVLQTPEITSKMLKIFQDLWT